MLWANVQVVLLPSHLLVSEARLVELAPPLSDWVLFCKRKFWIYALNVAVFSKLQLYCYQSLTY